MARTKRPADYHDKNIWESCGKCAASVRNGGYINAFRHIDNGICYECKGRGGKFVSQAQLDRREADRRRREAKRAAALDQAVKARETFKTDHPQVHAWMEAQGSSFAASLMESFLANTLKGRAPLSDKQMEAATKAAARDAERAAQRAAERAAADPVPAGRQTVTGQIVSIRSQEKAYGTQTKILVRDARGFKVWGNAPRAITGALYDAWYTAEEAQRGDDFWAGDYGPDYWHTSAKGRTVTFTATLEASDDDETFGFFTRPTKAALVEN